MNYGMICRALGKIVLVVGALMLLPLTAALLYGESWLPYAFTIFGAAAIGSALCIVPCKSAQIFAREGIITCGLTWILLSLLGALPLWLSGDIPSYLDAVFEVVSGFTTTGASILTDVEKVSIAGNFWRCFTHWIGGMGVLVFVMAILPQSDTNSMHLMRAEVPGPVVGKITAKLKWSARILYTIYLAMTAIMAVFLLAGGMPLYDSLLTSFATAGTGGFAIKGASIAAYNSAYIDIVVSVFMLLFSVNFNLYYMILIGSGLSALRSEELHWFCAIVGGSVLAIALNITRLYGSFGRALRYALFQVSTVISTTGFATADYDLWPNFSKAILVTLMFVGACAGSTGGGIKICRIIMLCKNAFRQIVRSVSPRAVVTVKLEGKIVDDEVTNSLHSYMYTYIFVYVFSFLLLSLDRYDLWSNFTAVAACINNIGPGLGAVGPSCNFSGFGVLSKLVLIFDMLAGRLELFPILILFNPKAWSNR